MPITNKSLSPIQPRYITLSVLIVSSLMLWWLPLRSTLDLALHNDAYTHLLLVPPLSLCLIYLQRKSKAVDMGRYDFGAGGMVLVGAISLRLLMWTPRTNSLNWGSLQVLALIVFWFGSVLVCFGFTALRRFLFPLCFLLLFVPLPDGVVAWLTEGLQTQSAVATQLLFRAARVPVTRDGVMLSIPKLDIEVARECSSIRSSTMLVVATLVLAHLFLRSWWRQTFLVLLSIPLSVLKNAIRIFTIVELGTRVDPSYLNGRLHHNGGPVFLAVALVIDVLILSVLRHGDRS